MNQSRIAMVDNYFKVVWREAGRVRHEIATFDSLDERSTRAAWDAITYRHSGASVSKWKATRTRGPWDSVPVIGASWHVVGDGFQEGDR